MDLKSFKRLNNIFGIVVLAVSSFVYLSTIEPTTSFWDCGEFIASSYKLEVGHPPGNPVFQLIARFFTLFAGPENAAMMVNAMSAICSALTIMFLFWTITHLGRRILEKSKESLSSANGISVLGAGLVGSLAYCFSDTFWFSAVEGEVYAMSSLFTAAVFWAMLKWEEQADEPNSNRWIVLIAFLMGLSIGVHLLNLLTIPALVLIYYYKKYEVTKKGAFYALIASFVLLAVILFGVIPYLPKMASWFDLLFVNVFGLPFNSGAVFFMVLLLSALFFGLWYSYKKGKVLVNTALLCFTMIVIGYSAFAVVMIRSVANTPTNENQPDNPFSLVRYLGREQYGSNPLVYGESFASPYSLKSTKYYTKVGNRYKKVPGPLEPVYESSAKMFFPRMWSSGSKDHVRFYQNYTKGRGKSIPGSTAKMPYFKDNMEFFFDYQVSWMYMRYFMWNFAGRQNDLQGSVPGDPLRGNWESGISFLDKARLGDQSEGPDYIVNNKAKNHYYMLPLLLGMIGLFYQLSKDKQNWWITMLLFLLTGLAIVVYLNQPPYQPRERDYAYAGSFYMFAIWIGLAVMAIHEALRKWISPTTSAWVVSVASLIIPFQMGAQNWDDHDRSDRYTARDIAYNYLMTCDKNAILVTHGDNDTFPLWYIQEVEGVRTDVRIVNTSLLGTDWYIDQMKYKVYDSEPLRLSIPREDYLYGTNDFVQIEDKITDPIDIKPVIEFLSTPGSKFNGVDGELYTFFPARKLIVRVNKENALKSGIVSESEIDQVPDSIILNIPEGKRMLGKAELTILDLIANYQWDRPIYFAAMGGDLEIGIIDYLEYDGFAYKFVPFKSTTSFGAPGRVASDRLYNRLLNVYRWGNMNDPDVNIDYHNLLTFNAVMSIRNIHTITARNLMIEGKPEKAIEVLDKMQEVMIPKHFPLNCSLLPSLNEYSVVDAVDIYLSCGAKDKGVAIADAFIEECFDHIDLFAKRFGNGYLSKSDIETNISYIYYVAEMFKRSGMEDKASEVNKRLEDLINAIQ